MKRILAWIACLGIVASTGAAVSTAYARTDVSVRLNFGDRYRGPDLYWQDEPRVILVPGTPVYYVRDYDYDVYRYGRFWYYNYDGGWYRSRSYRGPWIYVGYRSVPTQISYVPQRYRRHWREFRDDTRYGSSYRRDYRRDRNAERWRDRDRSRDDRDRRSRDRYRDDRDRDIRY